MQRELPANRLKELREKRGLKLYDIAARIRRNPSTIWRWEQGEAMPDWAKLALAELYEVSPSYLMGWDDKVAA